MAAPVLPGASTRRRRPRARLQGAGPPAGDRPPRPRRVRVCPIPRSRSPFEIKQHEHAASLPCGRTEQEHSPSTGNGGQSEDAPPFPSTELAFQEQEQEPVGSLPADVLVEILSQVPYRSLCRFKCVSKPWLAFCSDPDILKRSSQTLSGFFYNDRGRFKFYNLSGRGPSLVDPSLPFLRGIYDCFLAEQCCGGLLLCKCWVSRHVEDKYDYVVCNPMTGQWVVLPPMLLQDEEDTAPMDIFLGFDAAAPSRFAVFRPLVNCLFEFSKIAIYKSETGRWTTVKNESGYETDLLGYPECVFLNGTMHLSTFYGTVVTVDAEGKVWREIEIPDQMPSSKVSIGQSQGRLYAWQINNDHGGQQLYVWVFEDYASAKWTLKHTVSISELFGRQCGKDDMSYAALAIHPDCDCILLTDEQEMAVLYDMDNQKVNVRCTFQEFHDVLPYIPCFAEWSSDCH